MLTTKQAAERLGVSPQRVRKLIQAGRIEATKFGRDWMITEEALAKHKPLPRGWQKGRPRTKAPSE